MTKSSVSRKCSVQGCTNKHRARGLCSAHYQKWHAGRLDAKTITGQAIEKKPGPNPAKAAYQSALVTAYGDLFHEAEKRAVKAFLETQKETAEALLIFRNYIRYVAHQAGIEL